MKSPGRNRPTGTPGSAAQQSRWRCAEANARSASYPVGRKDVDRAVSVVLGGQGPVITSDR